MDNSSSLLFFFLSGVGIYATMFVWRKAASRWSTWFPLLRKSLEWGLIALMGGLALYALYEAMSGPLPPAQTLFALALGIAVPELYQRFRGTTPSGADETQRGSEVVPAKEVARRVKATKQKTFIELGGVPIPESSEPYHFLIAGSTGTGKSVAINTLLAKIRERGDTAILVDSGGDFLNKHFREDRDFVFNPFDERCVGWSPTLEMQGAWDAQALARSIIPDGIGDSREWNSYAQTFVGSVLRKLWEANRLTLADFLYYVQVAPMKELKELLEGTPAVSQMNSEKMFGSIRTIASNYLSSYDYLPTDKESFSLTQMIQAEHSGILFVTYRDDQLDALRNIIASLLDVAARAVLSLEPNPNRRVWLIIDEFASIGRVQSVEAVATKARKAGGCLVLGIQSISQLKDRYGDNGAQTILSCLSSWLVLRCSDADTSEYMSRYIGEAEVSRSQTGKSSGDSGDSSSVSEQRLTKRVVLGSEIQQFENLHGLLKLAGGFPVCSVKLAFPPKPVSSEKPFISRDFVNRPLLKLTQRRPAEPSPAPAPVAASQAAQQPQAPSVDAPPTPRAVERLAPRAAAAAGRPNLGVQVPQETVERLRERQGLPKTVNLLVEASRGVPSLAERLRELERQRAQTLSRLSASPAASAAPAPQASPPAPVASALGPMDLKALAEQARARVAARAATQALAAPAAVSPKAPARPVAAPVTPASAATSVEPPLLAPEVAPTVAPLAAESVQPLVPQTKPVQAPKQKRPEPAGEQLEEPQEEVAGKKRRRRNRRATTRDDLGDLLR